MKTYEVHFYTKSVGDGTHLFEVPFVDTPQVGWTVIVNEVKQCRGSSGIGEVTKVVMQSGSEMITVFVKEKV